MQDPLTSSSPAPPNLRVAILDADDLYRQYVMGLLAGYAGVSVRQCADSAILLDLLASDLFDCVLIEQDLGAETGIAVAGKIQRKYPNPPPLILLSGEGDERLVAKAFRSGFTDYLSKRDLRAGELMASIRQSVDRATEIRAGQEARERIDRLSAFDPVSGLYARHYMLDGLNERLASAQRRSTSQALIMARLGKLNTIKDQFGHAIGARAMRAFGIRLQKAARRDDVVGRFGRDSFLYLVDGEAEPSLVASICAQLGTELNFEANFDHLRLRLTSTLAVASFPADGNSADLLLQMAESRLGPSEDFDPALLALPDHSQVNGHPSREEAIAPPPARITDLRSERRQRVLKRGQIVLPERRAVIDCTIRDISSRGARLNVEHYFAPLDRFDLRFMATGAHRTAQTRWQIGGNVGVEFLAA